MYHSILRTALLVSATFMGTTALAQETQTITDPMGRVVEIPLSPQRIVTNFRPLPSAYYISTGSVDELVGVEEFSRKIAERSIFGKMAPKLLDISIEFSLGNQVNVEEVLKLAPDLFVSMETVPAIANVEKTGIPVVAMDVMSQAKGDVFKTFEGWMNFLGKLNGQQKRTDSIIAYAHKTLEETRAKTAALTDAERPGILFFTQMGEGNLQIAGNGHFNGFWAHESGALDLAPSNSRPLASLDMEQVYSLNPEIIVITTFNSDVHPEDLYENRIPDQDWSHVKAVQNHQVYQIPEGIFNWFVPSADSPLMLKWLAKITHPDLFSNYTIESEIRDYYTKFYGYTPTEQEIASILFGFNG